MPNNNSDIRKQDEQGFNANANFFLKLSIKDVDVILTSVMSIVIREWVFDVLPRIEIEIFDNGWFTDKFPLEDNDKIKIELNHLRDDESVVETEFELQDYEIINSGPGKSEQTVIRLTGLMKTNNFKYEIKTRSFKQQSSDIVFKNLSNDIGFLNYESRIVAQDKMSWLQTKQNDLSFMEHVLKRSFFNKNDSTFLFGDRAGNLIYTSLETELKRKQEPKQLVFNLEGSLKNNIVQSEEEYNEDLRDIKEQFGTENIVFYRNWQYKNISGQTNKTNTYGRSYSYYDMASSKSDSIVSDIHELSVHSFMEKDKIGKIVKDDQYGLFDSSNTHLQYITAQTQNEYVRDNFFSSPLIIYTRPDKGLKLFDTVQLWLPTMMEIDTKLDEVHSGQYVIGGILHEAQKNGLYSMILILYRNGLDIKTTTMKDLESRHSS